MSTYRFLQGQWISLQLEKEVPLILLFPYKTIIHEVPPGQKIFCSIWIQDHLILTIWVVGSPLLRSVRQAFWLEFYKMKDPLNYSYYLIIAYQY